MRRRECLAALGGAALLRAAEKAPLLRVPVWPADGNVIEAAALSAKVENRPARVVRARGPGTDLLVLLVLDLTGDLTLVDSARQTLQARLDALPANVWVGLFRSQDGLHVLADPSPGRAAVKEAIESLQIAGRAGLLETIEPAARLGDSLIEKSPVRLALLYVTDSNIHNYREDYTNPVINYSDQRDLSRRFPEALVREKTSRLAETLASLRPPLFVVHLAFLRDRLNEAYQTGLQQMAEITGGQARFCRALTDIPGEIEQCFERVVSHWAVDFEPPDRLPKTFSVQLSAGDRELSYRTRFNSRRR
jgi:hypothetical protein